MRGVEKNLAQLKDEGKIVRVGGRKGGHWEMPLAKSTLYWKIKSLFLASSIV